ncbi:unnamed protein product [Linum trigynum]
MVTSAIPSHFNLIPPTVLEHSTAFAPATLRHPKTRKKKPLLSSTTLFHVPRDNAMVKECPSCPVRTRASSDGGSGRDTTHQQESTNTETEKNSSSSRLGDSYIPLFIRMLGLDNDPLDREQAIVALWKYSLGGNKCVDNIMQFQGCINLTINLLNSESSSSSEAAAGLLRSISSVNQYRAVVAESGAIEEINGLLSQPSSTSEVKEQSICTLWNLSVDERLRTKIASSTILPLLIMSLKNQDIRVKEAAGGVLANLALTSSNHKVMVEAGIIPKLAEFLKSDPAEEYKVIRKEARNALLELSKNDYYRLLVIEEGLVPVPLIGAAAYSSFAPSLLSWPSLPDGTEIERTARGPSRYGASELLLGLSVDEKSTNIQEAKIQAMIGRSKQQFLARTGAIEIEDNKLSITNVPSERQFTLLPWIDGVARLVLILELQDESAISRAAGSIADASINEHMRTSFMEAGAVKHLVRLLYHNNDSVRVPVLGALVRLSPSYVVCQKIEEEGVMTPLINFIKNSKTSSDSVEKALDLLARIMDPSKEMKSKFYDGPVNGYKGRMDDVGGTETSVDTVSNLDNRLELLDTSVIAHLVEMLRHSSPSLQRKAATVLEFMANTDAGRNAVISASVESGLHAAFQQSALTEINSEDEIEELDILEVEEAGLVISAASQLLAKLLDSDQFRNRIDLTQFSQLLREILKSNHLPLHHKDWVSACLIKLSSSLGSIPNYTQLRQDPTIINTEVVTLYETIPRLVEKLLASSLSSPIEEITAAVVELNRIISGGEVVAASRAVASTGGIFPLVKLLERGGNDDGVVVDAAVSILYNLSMDSENHPAIIAAGAVPVLRRIILSQRPQWKKALLLLRALPT